ncbi:hypothetical protein WR25_17543 [Diploscapter pachys]|uniref:Uncharacterized protein n=1 Tax=Diploscapter pachys TaxID=2018661 RepID=A0A2A2KBY9_9BILA|nr:hypothetical protein WR25_17543 [Diploscapter pachys]
MVKDAERFAEEDKKRRAGAEAKNNAESLIHTTERQLADNGDKVDDSLKDEQPPHPVRVSNTRAACGIGVIPSRSP